MERFVLCLGLGYLVIQANAQVIPNSGFENWDSTYYTVEFPALYPDDWIWSEPNTPCWPVNFLAAPSLDSHAGQLSARLGSFACTDDLGIPRLEKGLLYSGNGNQPAPRNWAFDLLERPGHLQFYYKFHPEGGDSAYVKVLLFNYDSITPGIQFIERIDTVAFSSGYMHDEVTSFIPYDLPVQYLTADTPAFIHIYFSTSKTLSENPYGNTPPGQYASPGTTLWVDDIQLTTGAESIADGAGDESVRVYPVPGRGPFIVTHSMKAAPGILEVLDVTGHVVHREALSARSRSLTVPLEHLPTGVYLFRLQWRDEVVTVRVVVT